MTEEECRQSINELLGGGYVMASIGAKTGEVGYYLTPKGIAAAEQIERLEATQ